MNRSFSGRRFQLTTTKIRIGKVISGNDTIWIKGHITWTSQKFLILNVQYSMIG